VEAKKVGAAFTLPSNHKSGKLGGVLKEGEVGEAIRQVRDYCRIKHIPFAVVTNGNAWIVFPAVRTDEVSFEETQARIFRNLKDIKDRLVEFWELLSRQRVAEGNLENELLSPDRNSSARRVLSLIQEPGFRLGRNALYEHIEPAINSALTDEALLNDTEALKLCYVKSSERVKYDSRLQMYVNDAKSYLGHKTIRVRSRKSTGYFETKISEDVQARPRFILVLGAVGSGKTTFLHYTRKVSAAHIIEKKIPWLYIDFKKTTVNQNPRQFLYEELLRLIEQDAEFDLGEWDTSIRPAYADIIHNLERGPLHLLKKSNPDAFHKQITEVIMKERTEVFPYVERILKHVLTQRAGFLVIDNVDQIDSDERQNEIFGEAQAAAQRIGVNIIMSLRESTFLRHRNSPVFDAFQFDSLYIDPPNILPVLSRRFSYAKQVLAGKKAELTLESGARLKVNDISVVFEIVAQSVLASDSGFMIEMLAGGDVRRGLSLVREFLSSGHTTADRALEVYSKEERYQFPPHEIFKGAVLGKRKVYREEESLLPNLYDAKLGIESLQLLRFYIVHRLVELASEPAFEGMPVSEVIDKLHLLGVPSRDVESAMSTLFQSRIIRTADGLGMSPHSAIIPTRLAGYMIQELGCAFTYVEMCLIDSFIFDADVWKQIADLTKQIETAADNVTQVKLRIERTRVYIRYLAMIEEKWVVECKRRGLEESWGKQIIATEVMQALEGDMRKVSASADRMARR
jgi:GTPase SAR1 family protein